MTIRWPGKIDFEEARFGEWELQAPDTLCVTYSATSSLKEVGHNEDSLSVVPLQSGGLVISVADGVGGHRYGDQASRLALETVRDGLNGIVADEIRTSVLDGLEVANQRIMSEIGGGAATTYIGAELVGRELRTYNIGDSGAMVFGGKGKLKLQTIADSPVGYALHAGVIDEETAMRHVARHIVSNVLGSPNMHVTVSSTIKLRPRDTLVLASDGLFDNIYVEEIIEILRKGPLGTATKNLIELCHSRMLGEGKPDDLTVVTLRQH